MEQILNKILCVVLVLSYLNVIRHTYNLFQVIKTNTLEMQNKYKINKTTLFWLAVSIAYILETVINGTKIN